MVEFANTYDVVVVGCGPTGATLANLLSLSGVKVLVIERENEIYDLPRAVHFDDETMRVFQTICIADPLQEKIRVNPGMRFVDTNDNVILDWPRPQGTGKHGWNSSYRLHQPDLEKLLRDAIMLRHSCTLKLDSDLIAFNQNNSNVQVSFKDRKGKQSSTVNAKFLVGCDGANSTVRSLIPSRMEDFGFNERWLVVDVLLNHSMPELGDFTIQYCHPEQAMTYCRNPGRRRRWEMALPNSITVEKALNPERIWSLLARWINPEDAKIERKAIYTFRSALAKKWRNKRVLIAGDAAHLTPPFMGQGMCTGIRDASNLAWKLAMCVKGLADDNLLDSYQEERHPHAMQYIKTAMGLGKLINSIDQHTAKRFDTSDTTAKNVSSPTMASLDPALGHSKTCHFGTLESEHTGQLFAQPRLKNGLLLDDYCGYQSVLLTRQSLDQQKPANKLVHCLSGDEHPEIADALNELNVIAALVRPDRYILATVDSDAGMARLLNAAKVLK